MLVLFGDKFRVLKNFLKDKIPSPFHCFSGCQRSKCLLVGLGLEHLLIASSERMIVQVGSQGTIGRVAWYVKLVHSDEIRAGQAFGGRTVPQLGVVSVWQRLK